MTNAELIAKIKAEIERRRDSYLKMHGKYGRDADYIAATEDLRLLEFLSTLEESEKPINSDDAMKELDEKIALVKQRGTWDGIDVDKYMDEVRGREPEKSMNLEEEINRYLREECSNDDEPSVHEIARHFAQWGAEHAKIESENPVPNDLEEAANKFAVFYDQGTCDGIAQECFIAGAKWQREQDEKEQADLFTIVALDAAQRAREQMLKVAVNGWLDEDNEPPYDLNVVCEEKIPFGKFKHGDKVKLIIIKEE